MTLVAFLLAIAIVARGSRLITTDTITEPIRTNLALYASPYIHGVYDQQSREIVKKPHTLLSRPIAFVSKLINCDWCTTVWLAAAVVPFFSDGLGAADYVGYVAALSFLGVTAITVHDAIEAKTSY